MQNELLGSRVGEYRSTGGLPPLVGGALFVLGLLFCGMGLNLLLSTHQNNPNIESIGCFLLLVLGLPLGSLGIWLLIRRRRKLRERIQLYEHGMIWPKGAVMWNNLSELNIVDTCTVLFWKQSRWRSLQLRVGSTKPFWLSSTMSYGYGGAWINEPVLVEAVLELALPILAADLLPRYAAGETLDFGVVKASRVGLETRKRHWQWTEIQSVTSNIYDASHNGCGKTEVSWKIMATTGKKVIDAETSKFKNLLVLLLIMRTEVGLTE